MTVTTTINRNDYTASASQTVFAYQFRILANDDIKVYKNEVLQTLTTHYTVSGAGDATGGNVTFGTGLTAGDTVLLIRADALTQPTDYTASGPFAAETHETALDRLLMLLQDLDEKYKRAIKFELFSALSDVDAPEGTSATNRAGKVWAWNSAGTALQLLAATVIDAVSVIAVKGDIVQGNASGAAAKLAIGANGDMPYVATDLLAYDKPWGVCWKKGADIASASALTTGDDGNYFDVTGTVTITSIVTRGVGSVIRLHFDGALVLTHHATDLILPNGSNITTIAGDEATFIEYATGDWRMVAWSGHVLEHTHASTAQGGYKIGLIQRVTDTTSTAATGAVATGTTVLPYDDTIPQITEGDQYLTVAITPKDANHNLNIRVIIYAYNSSGLNHVTAALFQNAIANALACGMSQSYATGVQRVTPIAFELNMTAGTTSAINFYVRVGGAGAGTTTVNGTAGAREFGGVLKAYLSVTEEKLS